MAEVRGESDLDGHIRYYEEWLSKAWSFQNRLERKRKEVAGTMEAAKTLVSMQGMEEARRATKG